MKTRHTNRDRHARHVDALDEYHVFGVDPRDGDFNRTTFEAVRTAEEARQRGHREIHRVLGLIEGVEPGEPDDTHKIASRAEIASLSEGMGVSETADFVEYGRALGLTTRHVDFIRSRLIPTSPN